MNIHLNLSTTAEILDRRGLNEKGRVQQNLTSEIYRHSDPYTPFLSGPLKQNVDIGKDYIRYKSPYARFLWHGLLMVGERSHSPWARATEKKVLAAPKKELDFNGAPRRGKQWCMRMWADKGREILRDVAGKEGLRTK